MVQSRRIWNPKPSVQLPLHILQKSAQQLISLALGLHQRVAAAFLPTAIKFHYIFNLRDFSNIFQVSAAVILWHLEPSLRLQMRFPHL